MARVREVARLGFDLVDHAVGDGDYADDRLAFSVQRQELSAIVLSSALPNVWNAAIPSQPH